MTREEAIELLVNATYSDEWQGNEDLTTAHEMAIKALKQDSILGKIKAEIEQIEINGHIRDVECFRAGVNVALNVIDKYKAGE